MRPAREMVAGILDLHIIKRADPEILSPLIYFRDDGWAVPAPSTREAAVPDKRINFDVLGEEIGHRTLLLVVSEVNPTPGS